MAAAEIHAVKESIQSAIGVDLDYRFSTYLTKFGKIYKTVEEFERRRKLFQEMDTFIRDHNSDKTQTFKVGHNLFSDMTEAERGKLLGLSFSQRSSVERDASQLNLLASANQSGTIRKFASEGIPTSIDWREKGAVTPVDDQG